MMKGLRLGLGLVVLLVPLYDLTQHRSSAYIKKQKYIKNQSKHINKTKYCSEYNIQVLLD